MSADNGVYILRTLVDENDTSKGYEYRVTEMQAVENIFWDSEVFGKNGWGQESNNPEVHIRNARKMWTGKMYLDERDALVRADELAQEILSSFGILEYGISTIEINKKF